MTDTHEAALSLLAAAPNIFREMLAGIPASIADAPLDRDWSPHRILAHQVDVEPVFARRLHRMIEEDQPTFTTVDALATLAAGDLESRPISALLDQLSEQRAATLLWLRTFSQKDLVRTATLEGLGEFTVANLVHYWPSHDLAHINGLRRMLVAVLRHEMGPTEEFDI